MNVSDIIKSLSMGAFVGCFIGLLVAVFISFQVGPQNISFSGTDIVNLFFGCIVAGWAFSLTGLIYEREDVPLPLQIIFQMGIGMTVLFLIAIYLKWMPIDLGMGPIITWVAIACVFAVIFWCGFYIYYYLLARNLNKKIVKK
jgi:drug/metabolite transporter (DMT)-like permease